MSEFERFLSNVQALLSVNDDEPASTAGPAHDATTKPAPGFAQDATSGPRPADAIEAELARPARTTAITSLRDSPEVEAFRNELIDGLIRVDTANQLLRLLNTAISRFLV